MYDLIDFKNNAIILQALVAIIFVVNMLCAVLKSNSTQYTYISSSVPELPDRRESVFPELPADIIRTRPAEAQRRTSTRLRKYSTSASTFERNTIVF